MRLATRLSGKERLLALFGAWRSASGDTDIEVRIGRSGDGEPAVLITVGESEHALAGAEIDAAIRVVKKTVDRFGQAARAEGLHNLLFALEEGRSAARALAEPDK